MGPRFSMINGFEFVGDTNNFALGRVELHFISSFTFLEHIYYTLRIFQPEDDDSHLLRPSSKIPYVTQDYNLLTHVL